MDLETPVPMGVIGAAHGLKGEVRLRLYNPSSTLLQAGMDVVLLLSGGHQKSVRIETARRAAKGLLVAFRGVTDRSMAQSLTGTKVAVRRDALPPLNPGEFYYEDLVNLPVRFPDGGEVGRVSGILHGATAVLVIDGLEGEIMVPVVEGFVVEIGADCVIIEFDALDANGITDG